MMWFMFTDNIKFKLLALIIKKTFAFYFIFFALNSDAGLRLKSIAKQNIKKNSNDEHKITKNIKIQRCRDKLADWLFNLTVLVVSTYLYYLQDNFREEKETNNKLQIVCSR